MLSREFKQSVSSSDARDFNNSKLEDVYKAARSIETQLAARGSLRNTRRLQPFFKGLEHYSKVMEVLCNGTPYLSWIWVIILLNMRLGLPADMTQAPIMLILQLTSDYVEAFDKLITAYHQIAMFLSRFDRLSTAFKDDSAFQ
jgi:hypothetical protein